MRHRERRALARGIHGRPSSRLLRRFLYRRPARPLDCGSLSRRSPAAHRFRPPPHRDPRCRRQWQIHPARRQPSSPGRNRFPLRRTPRARLEHTANEYTMTSAVEHLSKLIRIASNSATSNRAVVEYAADVLHSLGWTTRAMPYRDPQQIEKLNLIAAPRGQNISAHDADLVLMCHTDTVPFAPDWDRALDPFIRNGHLHGCGACDVKGFLACILTAASAEPQLIDGLRIVLTADEEVGCIGAGHLLADKPLRPRRVIIGEPTSLRPARAGKGYCLAEVTVTEKKRKIGRA